MAKRYYAFKVNFVDRSNEYTEDEIIDNIRTFLEDEFHDVEIEVLDAE